MKIINKPDRLSFDQVEPVPDSLGNNHHMCNWTNPTDFSVGSSIPKNATDINNNIAQSE